MSLSKKATLTALLLFIAGLLPLVYFSSVALERSLIKLLANQQASSVQFIGHELEQQMQMRIEALQDIANNLPAEDMTDRAAISNYLLRHIAICRLFAKGVSVIGRGGYGVADQPQVAGRGNADFREMEYFLEVLRTGKPAIGKPRLSRFSHDPVIAVGVPIRNTHGELVGVMAGFLSLKDKQIFKQTHAEPDKPSHFSLVSSWDNSFIADSNKDYILKPLSDIAPGDFTELVFDGLDTSKVGVDLTGRPSLMSDTHILNGRWILIGSLPVDVAFTPITQLKAQIYVVALAILVLFGALMWWVMQRQLGIVTRATRSLERMAQGHDALAALPVNRHDEVGEMIRAFNALQAQIQAKDQALQQSKTRFQNLFEHMSNGFALHEMIFDAQGVPSDYRFLEVNPAFETFTGMKAAQLIGKTVLEVMPELEGHWIKKYGAVVASGQPMTFEDYAKQIDRWYQVTAYCPEQGKFAVVMEDITELKKIQNELSHLAYHDVLTGLPNRALFSDRVQLALAQTKRRGTLLAITYMDLDNFKPVNDRYGHAMGDRLLIEVSKRLKDALRWEDSVSRFGGDEFAILLADLKSESELHELLNRLIKLIAAPYSLMGQTIEISTSMGVTVYPQDNSGPDILMRHADEALYAAKKAGRNCYQLYRVSS